MNPGAEIQKNSTKSWYILLLLYLIQYVKTESAQDLTFTMLPLCDTAILVSWKPKENESADGHRWFTFSYEEIRDGELGPSRLSFLKAQPNDGQIKLNNFRENTNYRISIYEENLHQTPSSSMIVFMHTKTRQIDFLQPAKPDFDYKIWNDKHWNSVIKIIWYPCGKEYKCHDEAPGCNFFVKYRIKGAQEFHKISEYDFDFVFIRDCLPGKVYEFIVASNNVPFETESDIKEIVVPPDADPVNNLEALSLNTFSVLLSWEPPRKINGNLTGYKIFYENKEKPFKFIYNDRYDNIPSNQTRAILSHFQPNAGYRISIAARTDIGLGSVNSIDIHTPKNDITSTPFKPSASFTIININLDLPKLKVLWLPCGPTKNCQGQNAGYYFEVKFKLENESEFGHLSEHDQDFLIIENLLLNITYEFIIVSVGQTYKIESDVYKILIPSSGQRVAECIEGDNITLLCSTNSSNELKVKPKWLKNDVELTLGKFIQQPNTDLLMTNVSIRDSGKYACTIPSSPLKMDDIVFLSVKKRSRVKLARKSKHKELKVADEFSLLCEVITDPLLNVSSYKWLKDGNQIDFNANTSLTKTEINVLKFLNASVTDNGNYTCVATTRLDSSFDSIEIIVLSS